MKNAFFIIGNGFSIDFLNYYAKFDPTIAQAIDVVNLFHFGDKIQNPWTQEPGLLSYKYCPSLWTLGARTNNSANESNALIEEILTCANMFFDFVHDPDQKEKRMSLADDNPDKIYLRAYSELVIYLKQLFSCYDTKIDDKKLEEFLSKTDWGWAHFFKHIEGFGKITIITYNYDIWLERILQALKIPFGICGFEDCSDKKIELIKPHGSISFVPKTMSKGYGVRYGLDFDDITMDRLSVQYSDLTLNDKGIIIPPAGDSIRLQQSSSWASSLREEAKRAAKSIQNEDDVVLCGISYWHVDRRELDSLLVNLNQDSNFIFINPNPPRDLNAVLISVFKNYIVQSSSSEIGGILNGKVV